MPNHDNAYKNFFSHPQTIQDLLRGFVGEDWVDLLDFETLEKVNGSYVTDDLRDKEDDLIWRIHMKNGKGTTAKDAKDDWIYVYLLLEFQSRVDKFMAVRIMTYIGLLYQDLIKSKKIKGKAKKLPPVFPLVLYNGLKPWKAEREVENVIEPVPKSLAAYRPSLRYFLLDEGTVDEERLNQEGNAVARLIEIEKTTDPAKLPPLLKKLLKEFNAPHNTELRRGFVVWINRIVLKRFEPFDNLPEMDDLPEMEEMIGERIDIWKRELKRQYKLEGLQEGREEGREKGREEGRIEGIQLGEKRGIQLGERKGKLEGQIQLLLRFLMRRFGVLPPAVVTQIHAGSLEQVEQWFDASMDAPHLGAVFVLH